MTICSIIICKVFSKIPFPVPNPVCTPLVIGASGAYFLFNIIFIGLPKNKIWLPLFLFLINAKKNRIMLRNTSQIIHIEKHLLSFQIIEKHISVYCHIKIIHIEKP